MLCFSDEEQNLNYIVRKIKRVVVKNPQKKINLIPFDYLLSRKLRAIFENDNVYVMDKVGWRKCRPQWLHLHLSICWVILAMTDYILLNQLLIIRFYLQIIEIKKDLNNLLLKIKMRIFLRLKKQDVF